MAFAVHRPSTTFVHGIRSLRISAISACGLDTDPVTANLPEQVEEEALDERLRKVVDVVAAKGARAAGARMERGRDCPKT